MQNTRKQGTLWLDGMLQLTGLHFTNLYLQILGLFIVASYHISLFTIQDLPLHILPSAFNM